MTTPPASGQVPTYPLRGLLFNVGLGFSAAMLLMVAVIGLGVTQMAHLNNELANVVSVNNVKTRLASQMRDALRDRAMLMHNIVVSIDPWEKDAMFLQFLQYGERYAKDRGQLVVMLNTPDEKRLMHELDTIIISNQPVMLSVVEAALDENNYGALTQLQNEAIPLQNRLVEALDNMTRLQREANEAALGKTFTAYQATRNLMLVLGIVATLLAVLVAVLVSRRMLTQTRQLDTEKKKYQTLFETNSDAVVILDDHGFTDCNLATLSLFGMDSVAAFLQLPISQLGTPIQANGLSAEDHARRAIDQAKSQGHAVMDWQGRRQDGSVFSAEIALHAMELEGRPVIQAIMRDVSERRAAEAAKEAAREAALHMAHAKSEFIANVSHEIRTPMHGILGMSGLLLKTPLDGRQREYAATLKSSAENLLTIINDILDFSKIEAGKLAVESIAFSPAALAQSVVALFQSHAMEKNLRLTLTLPANPPAALLGDPTRIRQILLNLVDNAIKFTQQGEIELHATFEATDGTVDCLFSVRDSGIGISAETQTRLFQAFSQADSSTTRRYGGTGLGLAISSQLAELMGGQLKVESAPGQGSRFTLALRLPTTTLPPVELPVETAVQLQGRILVAEDHPVNQKMLAHQLREMGLQYALASNGKHALEMLEADDFDLVLMDWQMPEMDGLEATRQIRRLPTGSRHIPIIALTANANAGFREACLAAGANDYLSKPYTEAALAALLLQWLPPAVPADTHAPLLDLPALHARYPGNPGLVNELEAVFHSTTAASLAALKRAIENDDPATCCKEAHALKGAAASVMAREIQAGAARIEASVQGGDFAAAAAELAALESLFRPHA
ncbi:MAG: histidine kinase [Betaproteobacteria bacterium HGW-Betaproteobacteria-17]|nr:MAG: histidine kinase [Betaproteobacteria bacterium HGW-Betaproteobacteria-17]